MEELVKVQDINKNYHTAQDEIAVIKDLNFSVYKGEFLSIVGPSGCGKTTVLSMIAGMIEPTKGKILIDGKQVDGHNDSVAYMLQRDHLFEWRTIDQNILLGLQVQKKCTKETKTKALDLLVKYGLGDFARYHPRQLSGGMRQKVALIRTLAVDPQILLLDEPFSSLDYQTRLVLSDEISKIIRLENKTAVLVTHDIAEAISMSDRVIVLSQRPATVKACIDISLETESFSPIEKRKAQGFSQYFDFIWKELAVNAN